MMPDLTLTHELRDALTALCIGIAFLLAIGIIAIVSDPRRSTDV